MAVCGNFSPQSALGRLTFYERGYEPQPNLLIVHDLLLSIRGCPPERTFPHPQPGGRAGWPEEDQAHQEGRLRC